MSDVSTKFSCPYCTKVYGANFTLRRHVRLAHASAELLEGSCRS